MRMIKHKPKHKNIVSGLLIFICIIMSAVALGQVFVPRENEDSSKERAKKYFEDDTNPVPSNYVSGSGAGYKEKKEDKSDSKIKTHFLSGGGEELTEKEQKAKTTFISGDKNQIPPDELEPTDRELYSQGSGYVAGKNYLGEIQKKEENAHKDIAGLGRTNFGFLFYKDRYTYKNNNETFNATFRESPKARFPLLTVFSFNSFRWLFVGYWSLGMDVGIGFNQGRALYEATGELSETIVTIWSVPLDFAVGYEIPLTSWFRAGVRVGPSLLLLAQNRSDRDPEDSDKSLYNYSPGYFGEALFKWNYFSLSKSLRSQFFKNYNSTNGYVALTARYQEYLKFQQKDVKVKGLSFGVGFVFDFL